MHQVVTDNLWRELLREVNHYTEKTVSVNHVTF